MLPDFEKVIGKKNFVALKTGEISLVGFSIAIGAAPRTLLPNRRQGFELSCFQRLSGNSKAFGAKRLRTY